MRFTMADKEPQVECRLNRTEYSVYFQRAQRPLVVALVLVGLGACATNTPLRSNEAQSYEGLVRSGKHALAIHPKEADFGRYRWATIEPIHITQSVAAELRAKAGNEVRDVLQSHLEDEVRKRFSFDTRADAEPALLLRVRITRITEASPAINVLTSLLVGPISDGALAVELEAVDADSGEQRALLLWADSGGGFTDLIGGFSRTAHARALSAHFAVDAAAFLDPLSPPAS
jgi:hypothetical protein